jgi:hypothetical protein
MLALIAGAGFGLGFFTMGQGARPPQVVETSLDSPERASSVAVESNGVVARVTAADAAAATIYLEFWFDPAPAAPTQLLLDAGSLSWDGSPVEVESATTGEAPSARIALPSWSPGVHELRIGRFGQAPAPDASGNLGVAASRWIEGEWVIAVELVGYRSQAEPATLSVDIGRDVAADFDVAAQDSGDGRWRLTLAPLDQEQTRKWVSVPAFARLPNGDLLAPESVGEDASGNTIVVFIPPPGTTTLDIAVSAWVTERIPGDSFVVTRASDGTWASSEVVTVVEDSELFGVTIQLPGDAVFSAFGDPELVDDRGNTYRLDWRRVGFGKSDPERPYLIHSGLSAARFIGPIDPLATKLTLTGGAGGRLVMPGDNMISISEND